MKYDFDELIERRGSNSYKWDSNGDASVLPLWVADMDFRTAPVVTEALNRRVKHGVFGYTHVPRDYYDAVVKWFGQYHNWHFPAEWIQYTTGVVPALSAVIKALTKKGDKVLALTPVYNCFFSSIRNNGCSMVGSRLVNNNWKYGIDYDDFEKKASDPDVRLLLFCNPHNPGGRVWQPDELARIGAICQRHGVRIVSDEIHGELVFPGHTYVPFASVSDELAHWVITCTSPSKAFNTAGLQIANIICSDADTRRLIDRAINDNEVCDVNPFGIEALMAAYSDEGHDWLEALLKYLKGNYDFLQETFEIELPNFHVMPLEGTYLAWVDCSVLPQDSEKIEASLLDCEKVWINAGSMYGAAGEHFIRINMACPRSRLEEGLRRTITGLKRLGRGA